MLEEDKIMVDMVTKTTCFFHVAFLFKGKVFNIFMLINTSFNFIISPYVIGAWSSFCNSILQTWC